MSTTALSLSQADARRLAITAQRLGGAPAATPLDILRHLGGIQLDAIQRVDKAHRLVCLARNAQLRGRQSIDQQLWSTDGYATVFESWAHAVCLLPMDDWPLWDFARRRTANVDWAPPAAVCDRLVAVVHSEGPQTLRQLEAGAPKSSGWEWSQTKRAAEYLLWTGGLVCAERRGSNRVYDLPQRRVPARLLDAVIAPAEALATLVGKALRACGIATLSDVAEYFRLARDTVASVWPADGAIQVTVEGWADPAWADPGVLDCSFVPAEPVFLTPFDNLVWDRERTRRLFGFDLVLEAYKPPAKRQYGYYVTPLLVGDELIGRADLTRGKETLHADAVFFEPDVAPDLDLITRAGQRLAWQLGCTEFTTAGARTAAMFSTP